MKIPTTTRFAALFVALCLSAGCKQKPSAFPLSLATLAALHTGEISYEERNGEIYVTLSDSSGDRHVHRLDSVGKPRKEVLEVLKSKQTELEKAGQRGADAKLQGNGDENWTVLVGDWSMDAKDVPGILSGSKAHLERMLAGNPSAPRERANLTDVLAAWDSYSCQIMPRVDRKSGSKLIWMLYFPTRDQSGMFKAWRTEPVLVEGGGSSYWYLAYDPEKHEYSGFAVNADK